MKIFATLLLMCALYSTGNAQPAPKDDPKLNDRAKTLTRRMAEKLPMSEGQYVKVRQLNLRLLTETADVRQRFANDATGLDEAMADIQMRYEWDLAAVLRPRQMAVYDQNKVNMTAVNLK